MADISRKEPVALTLKRLDQRTAELNYAISKLEVRKLEIGHELSNLDETIVATNKTLEEHLASVKNISKE